MTDTVVNEGATSYASASALAAPARKSDFWPRLAWIGRVVQSPWFAFSLILLLQLKVVWRAWIFRDMSSGDTSSYYADAVQWYKLWKVDIAWSPLYLAYYGSLMHLAPDAADVTILHRLLIVFAATAGVLAVLRRMLPHALALLVAAWWAVLPINFDALYEVHLFALLPILVVWLVAMRRTKTENGANWVRASVLAGLLATMFLVRNEMFVAVGCFGLVCLVYEYWLRRKRLPLAASRIDDAPCQSDGGSASLIRAAASGNSRNSISLLSALGRYVFCGLMTVLLVVFFYKHSYDKFPDLKQNLHIKHTLNMAQVYAAGYQQRHPEWDKSPWTDCQELCQRDFGTGLPTLTQMLRQNPRATLTHFAWNFHLVPAGLQVLLFDRTSIGKPDPTSVSGEPNVTYADSKANPDYAPVIYDPKLATPLTFAVVVIVGVGLVLLVLRRHYWWEHWLRDRAWGWAAMLAVASTVFLIIPTQRPRPSYLFSLSVLLMTLTGMCLFVILHSLGQIIGLRRASRWLNPASSTLAAGALVWLIVAVPSYYPARAAYNPQSLLDTYKILLPYQADIQRKDTVLLKGEYSGEIMNYVGWQKSKVLGYSEFDDFKPDESLAQFLDHRGINMVFIDDRRWSLLESQHPGLVQDLIDHGAADGWRLIGFADTTGPRRVPPPYLSRWLLFRKAPPGRTKGTFDSVPAGLSAEHGGAFSGWREAAGLGPIEGPYPNMESRFVCWGIGPSTRLTIPNAGGEAGRYKLILSGLSGLAGQVVTIKLDGQTLGQYPWGDPGVYHDLTVPLDLAPGPHQLELSYTVWQNPSVKMAVLFKKIQVVPEQ